MKILFVISTLRFGGAERVCALLSSRFAKDYNVVVAKFDEDKPFYEPSDKIKVLNLGAGVGKMGFLGNIKKRINKIIALRKFIKDEKFDLVISFMDSTNILTIIATLGVKTPIFISEHTSYKLVKNAVWHRLKRVFYPYSSGLSVLTRDDFDFYKSFVKNCEVIYNPFFGQKNPNLEKENLVIFAGRLIGLKGCDVFLKGISKLDDELKNSWKFAVAGDGELKDELEKMTKELKIDVKFLGNVKNIDEIYKKAKILVSSSRVEGLGNTLIEAIFYDCARVASKTSGACELIKDEFDGLLFDIDDEKTLCQKLTNLMRDEVKMAQICKNAKLKRDEFDIENVYKKWLEMIKKGGVNENSFCDISS